MDPVAEIVDTWLLEDELLPRKERRNAVGIYRQLKDEHGFEGSERTVREYVRNPRKELLKEEAEPIPYVVSCRLELRGEGTADKILDSKRDRRVSVMYSREERMKAIELYMKYDKC
jgi:hypothetical protein